METLESALALLLEKTAAVMETEELPLLQCSGRILGEDVTAPINVPPFDRSPLDGYALHSEDIAGATRETPVYLKVIGEACAGCGEVFAPARGEALRIMTGAPVPSCCDCVIRQEDTDQGMETAAFYASVKHGANICLAGEDIRRGDIVVRSGEKLTPAHIGVLASLGVTGLQVFRKPRVVLLSTGDELLNPGEPLTFGKIYNSTNATLTLRLQELGAECITPGQAADEPEAVAAILSEAMKDADMVITTGGVSVGKKDIMHQVLPLMGVERLFWKVAMKPGTPLLCGEKDGKLIICLSGNPFAALACFEVFAAPVVRKMAGQNGYAGRRIRAPFLGTFPKASKGRRLIRAFFDGNSVRLTGENHSSGSLYTMLGCNCLVDIPAGTEPLSENMEVEILLL